MAFINSNALRGPPNPASESRFRISDDRGIPVGSTFATVGVLDLIGPLQSIVDSPDDARHAVSRIQALVGIHLPCGIVVSRNLPTTDLDDLQACFDLLDGLVSCQRF